MGSGHNLPEPMRERLQVIYDLVRERGAWPTFRTVDLRFDRSLDIDDAQQSLAALPSGYLQGSWRPNGFYDTDEVRLSLRGVRECNGGEQDLQLLLDFMRWISKLEREYESDDEDLTVYSVDFATQVGFNIGVVPSSSDVPYVANPPGITSEADSEEIANRQHLAVLRILIDILPSFWVGLGTREPWVWQLTLDRRRLRPYRKIATVDELITYDDLYRAEVAQMGSSAIWTPPSQAEVETIEDAHDLPVELDSLGRSTDIEREVLSYEPIDEPFDPERIDVTTRTPTVDLLLARIKRGVLDLQPDFQRMAGIWSEQNQSRLVESMLLRIPLPTFYAAESDDDSWIIVDGVQRLTTIARFIDPACIGEQSDPLILRNLEYLRQYENKRFFDLPGRLQTRLLETELVLHLIRLGTPDPVMFNIFARINTGGRPLTRQELRHALIPGVARDLLRDLAMSEAFLRATLGTVSPERMDDREMVLRFLAFRLTDVNEYRPDFDDFLRRAMRLINRLPLERIIDLQRDFDRAMDSARNIFGAYAFRKHYPQQRRRSPINKALFETVSVNLARRSEHELEVLQERRDVVEARLVELVQERSDFERAISIGTGDAARVRLRFSLVDKMLEGVLYA